MLKVHFYLFLLLILPVACLGNGLNAELSLLGNPEFYTAGDTVEVLLRMHDDNDDTLHVSEAPDNGIQGIYVWVTGPRHNYQLVQPYESLRIFSVRDGFNDEIDFNTESGILRFTVPDDIEESGTYTILFDLYRHDGNQATSLYPEVLAKVFLKNLAFGLD